MWETCKAYLLYQNLTPKKHTSGCLQGSENLQDMILVLLRVQVQWDRTMRRVIMMEADVGDGSTPLLDTFDDIAEGQSKITIAQVKVCSGFSAASCGVHCTAAVVCRSAVTIRVRLMFIARPAASLTVFKVQGGYQRLTSCLIAHCMTIWVKH